MQNCRYIQGAVALFATLLIGPPLLAAEAGLVSGRVTSAEAPLPVSQVYAYQLGDLTLRKVTTDESGSFVFHDLPSGLYKIIAFKPGFLPGIALLSRASAQAVQFLEVELKSRDEAAADSKADFWSIRQQIPTDVLRDIDLAVITTADATPSPRLDGLRASMRAVSGVDTIAMARTAQLSGGQVDVAAEMDRVQVEVSGRYLALEAAPNGFAAAPADGYSQVVSVDVSGLGTNRFRVTSIDNELDDTNERIGIQSHRLSWSRDVGRRGRSELAAQYTAENNFYAGGGFSRLALPAGSRMWNLEGSYSTSIGERSSLEAGFRYRDRHLELVDSAIFDGILPQERVELFGRAGTAVSPAVLLEYGFYSTLRDGTLSFMPQGGIVLQLNDAWRASTSASLKLHEDPIEARRLNDFHTVYFRDYASCERAAAECYQVALSRIVDGEERLRLGAVHRRFDETLRLQFDENFFNYRENLQLVHGDSVPELRFALTQRMTPNILARFESNLGAGGGGRVQLADRKTSYENNVRYVVTSVDTLFEQTATEVFLAFHHLRQRFTSLSHRAHDEHIELERLQLMLTQDLAVLSSMAADWAVQLNIELSRGTAATADKMVASDEIRQRITGGLTVKF